jgi:hypothetical protein
VQKSEPKPEVKQEPKPEPKPQPKPVTIDDDDDDLLGDVISAPVKPVKNDKPNGGKPMLVMDDSDLDLI